MPILLPYPPTTNHYWTPISVKGRGVLVLSNDGKAYKKEVAVLCRVQKVKPLDGELVVTIYAYRQRRNTDLDNIFKGLFDALKGFAFEDDKQIVEIHAYRREDSKKPRVEISIARVG